MSQHNTDHLKNEFMRRAGMAEGGSVAHFAIGGQEKSRNWIKGSIEGVLDPLKQRQNLVSPDLIAGMEEDANNPQSPRRERSASRLREHKHGEAINKWIESNLANYIRRHMATHDDPIRKLAEEGIIHIPSNQVGSNRYQAGRVREKLGQPQLGKSEAAQAWEDAADVSMHPQLIKHIDPTLHSFHEPWMEKADPNTKVWKALDNMHAHYLGFDHLVDILKEDLAEGRIRPEQLSKISIEHAVRRAHDYDQEKKRKMAETALKATEGMPVHAEYPEGYKWIELAMPKELPEGWKEMDGHGGIYVDPEGKNTIHNPNKERLKDALKYEGDTMGHCVGGYCPDVAAGNKRIYSLRDAKNEPHVTIEVQPNQHLDFNKWWDEQPKELRDEINARARRGEHKGSVYEAPEYLSARAALPPKIKQIKGKQNQKPKREYIKFVQDFIKRGKWSDIEDLHNADLIKPTPHYLNQFYGPEDRPFIHAMEQKHGKDYWHPETIGEEYRAWNAKNKTGMAEGGSTMPQDVKAKLDQLKQEFTQLAERDRRAAQATWNAEQMANKKADGGSMREKNLAKFLKDSKVKERLYHGTNADIKKFDPKKIGQKDSGWYGKGFYFTSKPETASAYASFWGGPEEQDGNHPNVIPVHISLKNPYYWPEHKGMLADTKEIEKLTKKLKVMGHDGIIVNTNGRDEYIAFHPHQIKSAIGNRGTYDPTNPDLTMAKGGNVSTDSMRYALTMNKGKKHG